MRQHPALTVCFLLLATVLTVCLADVPTHCLKKDYVGQWELRLGSSDHDNTLSCANFDPAKDTEEKLLVDLKEPYHIVVDGQNEGFWTMVYDEGAELVFGERKFFAFAFFNGTHYNCDKTVNGWYHAAAATQPPKDWGCYSAQRVDRSSVTVPLPEETQPTSPARGDFPMFVRNTRMLDLETPYSTNKEYIARINQAQGSWVAGETPMFDGMAVGDIYRMSGGGYIQDRPKANPSAASRLRGAALPTQFDWRNVDGVNYVSPVRSQAQCGSCYAFSTTGMMESRVWVASNNTLQPILSPQEVTSCSQYSQGCDGGFPYLVSKWGEDFGLTEETCFPYKGQDAKKGVTCDKRCPNPPKHWFTGYSYVGGYYGACSEEGMMEEIINRGPVSVGFMVYPDLKLYKSGVYKHVVLDDIEDHEWEETNHAVIVVGWGVDDKSGEKYWIVKNSWGEDFGNKGYFNILKGSDECGIESMAEYTIPVLK